MTSSIEAQSSILFDQYSRYASAADAVRAGLSPAAEVIDVGSGEARLLGQFLPAAKVTYLDPLLAQDRGDFELSGTVERLRELPRTWDWAFAVDTLEHVPPADRPEFLDTMIAVARRGIVLSGPYREDVPAVAVDHRVNEVYRVKTGRDYSWLEEHASFGLPSLIEARTRFEQAGFSTALYGNGHCPWLEALLPLVVCFLDRAEHTVVMRELSEVFNRELYRFDHLEPVYRRILVAYRGEVPPPATLLPDEAGVRRQAAQAWEDFGAQLVARLARYADRLSGRIGEVEATAVWLQEQLEQQQQAVARESELRAEIALRARQAEQRAAAQHEAVTALQEELTSIGRSLSWRATRPLRAIGRWFAPPPRSG